MGRYRFFVAGLLALLCASSAVADVTLVTLFFDPADFYDWRPLDDGPTDTWDPDGGMFKLHEIWNVEGPGTETLRSWRVDDRQFLDDWADALSPSDIDVGAEGLGYFNIDLNQGVNSQFWGQSMQTPLSLTHVFAPDGWATEISGNQASWTAPGPEGYIRPDNTAYDDGRTFGFQFRTTDTIPLGSLQTVWFGGFNWFGYLPSLTFGTWGPPGFPSVDAQPGTGFEATLRLERNFIEADFNDDGKVDGEDFLAWQAGFGTIFGADHGDGDANFDGIVDGTDFLIWQSQLGLSVPDGGGGSVGVGAVPEPSTVGLVGVLLMCGVGVYCRFRPRANA